MKQKILVIVPAFNEEQALPYTLEALKSELDNNIDILVINDGSSDNTGKVAEQKEFVNVIHLPFNMGIGAAMQTGYYYAFKNDYDIAVQFDADGQHPANQIKYLVNDIIENKADMVIGSRFIEKTEYRGSTNRRLGIYYFFLLLRILTGQSFTDPTSGFRAVNRNIISEFAKEYPSDYPEVEVLISLQKKGFFLKEKSVNMKSRQGGKSSITPIKSIYYMVKVTISIMMTAIVRGIK